MAYTDAQLAALQAALASGVLRVTYGGETVEYRSVAELRAAIATVQAGLGQRGFRQVRVSASKGL